jgi:hypothetical protein
VLGVGTDDFRSTPSFFAEVVGLPLVVEDPRGVAILRVASGQYLESFGRARKGENSPPPGDGLRGPELGGFP